MSLQDTQSGPCPLSPGSVLRGRRRTELDQGEWWGWGGGEAGQQETVANDLTPRTVFLP